MGINDSKVQNLSNDNTDRPNDWKSFKISVPSGQIDQVMCQDNLVGRRRGLPFLPRDSQGRLPVAWVKYDI